MLKNRQRGFTLIEVLTVVMIIAVLASIILVSLEVARERTRDSTIKNQLGQIRSLAEAVYTFEDGYKEFYDVVNVTGHDMHSDFLRLKDRIEQIKAEDADGLTVNFSSGTRPRSYCAYAQLVRESDKVFCVDSLGDSVERARDMTNCVGYTNDSTSYDANCGETSEPIVFGGTTEPECTVDGDCETGLVCDPSGVCVEDTGF